MTNQLDITKIVFATLVGLFALPAAFYAQPLIHYNDVAVNVIVTVFSILAGFLVAIIAVVGDSSMMPPGSWRVAEIQRDWQERQLIRHKWLFVLYLVILGLVFLATLIPKQNLISKEALLISVLIERTFLFLGFLAFAFSMRLPGTLMEIQKKRIEVLIEHRKELEKQGPTTKCA